MKNHDGEEEEISYESLRQERIKENMERMQKLGVSDLSKKLLKPKPPTLPMKKKTTTGANPISQPSRRSSRLQNLTPVSYMEDDHPPRKPARERSSLPKTPREPRNPHTRSNHMKDDDEDEEDDEDEDEEEEEDDEDEEDEYNLIGFKADLCSRRSSRLQQAPQVSYAEISPMERSEIEIEDEDEDEDEAGSGEEDDVLVGEGRKPDEEHENCGAEQQPVSAKRYISFDNVEHSPRAIETVDSPSDGKPLDVYVGGVTSSSQLT